jgi:two-component system, LuxR family, response regulator FixJ
MAGGPEGTVHIVDDDASFLRSLTRLVRAEGMEARGWGSASEFLAAQQGLRLPACVVLDLKMPEMEGTALQEELVRRGLTCPVIFLSAHAQVPDTVRAMKGGAVDFLLKPVAPDQFLPLVRAALTRSAGTMRDLRLLEVLRERYARLTPREKQVLDLVVRGSLNKVIAGELGTALKTIKAHRGRVMRKMGAGSLAELVQQAVTLGLLATARGSRAERGAGSE